MRKVIFLFFVSASFYANTNKNVEFILIEEIDKNTIEAVGKCEIIRKNIYNDCVNHGFTHEEATSIADAALNMCKKVE